MAQVSDQQRSLTGTGTTSSSTISVGTTAGTYALRQAFSFAPDGTIVDVALNEAVPLGGGDAVGTLVTSTATSMDTLPDGSLHLRTTGTAAPVGEVNGQAIGQRALTVDLVLAPDLVQVRSERVVVAPGSVVDPPQTPTDPAPSVPPAPQSPAAQDPALPPGAEVSASPTDAVVVQDPDTR